MVFNCPGCDGPFEGFKGLWSHIEAVNAEAFIKTSNEEGMLYGEIEAFIDLQRENTLSSVIVSETGSATGSGKAVYYCCKKVFKNLNRRRLHFSSVHAQVCLGLPSCLHHL